jgi:transcriptional regulator
MAAMYQPPQFRSEDPAFAADLMREYPFASLISNDDGGFPFVTHLPLHLEEREARFVLLGHCAKPNPHWR